MTSAAAVAVALSHASAALAEDATIGVSGFIAGESRAFVERPAFNGQFQTFQPSLIVNPEFSYQTSDRRHQFGLEPFFRLDGQDDDRTHFDLREAYWRYLGDEVEVLVGLDTVFWGVTESRHLVNIINQIDLVEDIDAEDFLGEPMIHVATQRDWGRLGFFVMPGFRIRNFPGSEGRLRPDPPVDDDAAEFESGLEEASFDAAVRYSHFLGDWDIGLHYFYGTSREPRLLLSTDGSRLIPFYDQIHQVGLDLQYTSDAWLWKFEGIGRFSELDDFGAAVGGFEYTLFQAAGTDADLGILAEYLFDGRDEVRAPPTSFDNDVFLGTRLTLNDIQDTSALVGGLVDLEDGTSSLRLEAERRIGSDWKVELESQWFFQVDQDNPVSSFERDSFVSLRVSRFF